MAESQARYATALYSLSIESGQPDAFAEQAAVLRGVFQDAEYQRLINHPHITPKEKHAFLRDAFSGKIHEDLLGFLMLAIDKNREAYIESSLAAFIKLYDRYGRRTDAKVVSPEPLGEAQLKSLKAVLEKQLGKQVEIEVKLDPSIIGGLYIHVDGFFIDLTVKQRIRNIKDHIRDALRDKVAFA